MKKATNMLLQPRKYKSELVRSVLTIESRQTRLGDLFYLVSFAKDGEPHNFAFSNLDSAIDFVNSNFNPKYRF